jgi:peptidoglycan L-alanyl-D-glutamate endopeptidase CwlK
MTALLTAPPALQPFIARGASRELAALLASWHAAMEAKEIPVLIYTIYRSPAAQALLYAQGRTKPGHIVTYAKPGQSAHNREENGHPAADAFDACPLINGKPCWDTEGQALQFWNIMGSAAETLGLEWGRHYKRLGGDWAHFEFNRATPHTERIAA